MGYEPDRHDGLKMAKEGFKKFRDRVAFDLCLTGTSNSYLTAMDEMATGHTIFEEEILYDIGVSAALKDVKLTTVDDQLKADKDFLDSLQDRLFLGMMTISEICASHDFSKKSFNIFILTSPPMASSHATVPHATPVFRSGDIMKYVTYYYPGNFILSSSEVFV
jgi:hypothetical protein